MPTTNPSRADQIGALFAEKAEILRSTVARHVHSTDDVIDEACGFAWLQLLRHPHVDLTDPVRVFWWLYRTAQRQAWHLHERAQRAVPAGHPTTSSCDVFTRQPDASVDLVRQIEDREALRALHRLRPAVRDTAVLKSCGYTYDEIRAIHNISATTITKRVHRARQLAEDPDRSGG